MGEYVTFDQLREELRKKPDLVEVVRCRDCAVYDGEGYGCSYGRGDDPDGFCAWGERREP